MQDNQPTHEEVINGKYFRTLTVPATEPTSNALDMSFLVNTLWKQRVVYSWLGNSVTLCDPALPRNCVDHPADCNLFKTTTLLNSH